MPCLSANVSARCRSRAATATSRDPVASAGPTMDSSLMRAAPSTPIRSGSTTAPPCSSRRPDRSVRAGRGLRQQAADVVGAGAYVGDRPVAAWLLGEDRVLLERV